VYEQDFGTPLILVDGSLADASGNTVYGEGTVSFESLLPNGSIFYTVDGSTPTSASIPYSGPFKITTTSQIRAIVYHPDFPNGIESITAPITVIPNVALTITKAGGGLVAISPEQPNYKLGSEVRLTAQNANGWVFLNWAGDATGSESPFTLIMDSDKSVEVVFGTAVQTEVVGSGAVFRTPSQALYAFGSTVSLSVVAAPGWEFVEWETKSETNILTVLPFPVLESAPNIRAVFKDVQGPEIAIASGSSAAGSNYNLVGSIFDDSNILSVTWELNGLDQGALPTSSGKFNKTIAITPGRNAMVIVAKDAIGNTTRKLHEVVWNAAAIQIKSIQAAAESVQLAISSEPGVRIIVESSSDLAHWKQAGEIVATSNATTMAIQSSTETNTLFVRARYEK
jgi:hypothetical protein